MTDAPRTTARRAAVIRRPARALRRSTPLRRSTALLAASVLALAGCSGSDDGADAPAPAPASSPSASASAPGSATGTAAGMDEEAAAVADALAASREAGSGTFDFSSQTSADGQVVTATGGGSFDGATGALAMQLTSQLPGQRVVAVELRQVDGSAYVSGLPGQPADQWVEVPLEEMGASSGSFGAVDPSRQLTLLEQAGDVREVGQERVDGVETTHYAGVVDVEAVVEQAQQAGADADEVRREYERLGLSSVPFDLFVGPEGLPVRVATTLEASAQGRQVSSTSTVDLADWGSDVQVEAPQDAVPFSEAIGALTPAPTPAG